MSMVPGEGSSSVCVRADGKDRLKLNAQMSHLMQKGDRAVGLRLNVSQSLLPATNDLHVDVAGNMSSDRLVSYDLLFYFNILCNLTISNKNALSFDPSVLLLPPPVSFYGAPSHRECRFCWPSSKGL